MIIFELSIFLSVSLLSRCWWWCLSDKFLSLQNGLRFCFFTFLVSFFLLFFFFLLLLLLLLFWRHRGGKPDASVRNPPAEMTTFWTCPKTKTQTVRKHKQFENTNSSKTQTVRKRKHKQFKFEFKESRHLKCYT